MIKWLLKKSIWATEAKKWHGVSHNDESDVFHTFSSSFNILTLAADGCILSYYWCLIIHRWLYCLLVMIDDQTENYEGYEYTFDGLGLSESNETVYFQFRALTNVIRLILLF